MVKGTSCHKCSRFCQTHRQKQQFRCISTSEMYAPRNWSILTVSWVVQTASYKLRVQTPEGAYFTDLGLGSGVFIGLLLSSTIEVPVNRSSGYSASGDMFLRFVESRDRQTLESSRERPPIRPHSTVWL